MQKTDPCYTAYVQVLKSQLQPAMGCTEPIAIAYASAVAVRALGCLPEKVNVAVSGNIIKNAKSVTVPNTAGKKGIDAACAAGVIAGDPDKELQVISSVTSQQLTAIDDYLSRKVITVSIKPDARLFDILVTVEADGHVASARIADRHTNIVEVELDGRVLESRELQSDEAQADPNEALLSIENIYDFANSCDVQEVAEVLDRQIAYNEAIATEGITGKWGAAVGKVLLDSYGNQDVRVRARALAAAGSDARMSGCELPVIINSGSGNQGITVSIPVIEYAKELHSTKEQLYRALVLSNLVAIRQKALIGCLSAYCGAISAGCAAGAGIAFLNGGDLYLINHTIVNSLAILSGTICDGAKPSCAAKIASAVDAALTGYQMALAGKQFRGGEGIIKKGVENTIQSVGRLGKDGMKQTDEEILKIMTQG
ncbi:MAG: L-serine ammonia-lyase, iron-sulfur-dependent, subunit alpha [Eubacteriales bacterium]|nr:L-serine ammonia-lyase, iron-sulfur-dependent, subunit alpha [Eubacteriales bacterium]